jgi:hypothetical protein
MLGFHKHTHTTVEPSERVRVVYTYSKASLGGYRIVEAGSLVVEVVSRESVAASCCAHLNAGESRIDRHALIGCRVVPV